MRRILCIAALLLAGAAQAEISDGVVRIGVLNDISGVFQDYNGPGSVAASRMAADDFVAANPTMRVEIVSGDHQNRPDVGTAIVKKWLDVDRVDAVVDVPNSAVALSINEVMRNSRMTLLASSTATSDLTGRACSPNTVQWVTDSWAIARSTGAAMRARGGESWFFVAVDFALGAAIVRDTGAFLAANGARVLGTARHPLGTTDLSSFLLQAQASRAQVIALANAGPDTANAVKQAAEFGMLRPGSGQQIVGMLMFINDVHALGLPTAQGLLLTEAFYWDLNDGTRAFSRRYAERMGGGCRAPTRPACTARRWRICRRYARPAATTRGRRCRPCVGHRSPTRSSAR